jgi:hypothetical protein
LTPTTAGSCERGPRAKSSAESSGAEHVDVDFLDEAEEEFLAAISRYDGESL